jgi:hypothetical protein
MILILILLVSLTFPLFSEKQTSYSDILIQKAKAKSLHKDPYWIKLVHYRKNLLGDYIGEADNSKFYFSNNGKFSPEDELNETIKAFFEEDPHENEDISMQAQCAFPARFRWISDQLEIDKEFIEIRSCNKLNNWKKALNPRGISVIFTSYYLSSPASMMGHTLFKINSYQNQSTELLDYGVNYAANTNETNPFIYAWQGLTGGYMGSFAIYPYYIKVNEYNDMESRDIWEYELNLEGKELERFLDHLWELLWQAEFDYYFFSQNCSFHMMPLAEIARPTLSLSEKFGMVVTPPNTIKAYLENSGLVKNVKYRPSLYSRILQRLNAMTVNEKDKFISILNSKESIELDWDDQIRKDIVYDSLLDTYRYKKLKKEFSESDKEFYRKALLDRSKIQNSDYKLNEDLILSTRPEDSHNLSQFTTISGFSSLGKFTGLGYRFVQHDLMNLDKGFVPNSDLIMGDFRFRYYFDRKEIQPEKIIFIGATSLNPYDAITRAFSYKIEISIDSVMHQNKYNQFYRDAFLLSMFDNSNPIYLAGVNRYLNSINEFEKPDKIFPLNLEAYGGRTLQNRFDPLLSKFSFSGLLGAKAQYGNYFNNNLRYAPGAISYLTFVHDNLKIMLFGGYYPYQVSGQKEDFLTKLVVRYNFNKNFEIRTETMSQKNYHELNFSLHLHF